MSYKMKTIEQLKVDYQIKELTEENTPTSKVYSASILVGTMLLTVRFEVGYTKYGITIVQPSGTRNEDVIPFLKDFGGALGEEGFKDGDYKEPIIFGLLGENSRHVMIPHKDHIKDIKRNVIIGGRWDEKTNEWWVK